MCRPAVPLALWKCVVMVLQFKPYLLCYIMHFVSVGACIFVYSVIFPVLLYEVTLIGLLLLEQY